MCPEEADETMEQALTYLSEVRARCPGEQSLDEDVEVDVPSDVEPATPISELEDEARASYLFPEDLAMVPNTKFSFASRQENIHQHDAATALQTVEEDDADKSTSSDGDSSVDELAVVNAYANPQEGLSTTAPPSEADEQETDQQADISTNF